MASIILKHGPEANIFGLSLQYGELVSTNTGKLYIGDSDGNTVAVSPIPSSTVPKALGSATEGVEGKFARGDHVHPNIPMASTTAAGLMSSSDKEKLDGLSSGGPTVDPSTTTPKALGTAAVGTETAYARGDHVHPLIKEASTTAAGLMSSADKTKLNGIATGATAVSPSSTTPKALGTAAVGTETAYARGDHVHAKPSYSDVGAAASSHTHSTYLALSGGTLTGAVYANNDTSYTTSKLRNIQASTSDLTAGSSSLANGAIYLVYE